MIKNCEQCSKEFKIKPSRVETSRYCSRICKDSARIKVKEIKYCKACNSTFVARQKSTNPNKGKYCSIECVPQRQNKSIDKICIVCKSEFRCKPYRLNFNKYCSKACCILDRKGKTTSLNFYDFASEDEKFERLNQLFNKYAIKNQNCWEWEGSKDTNGYGVLLFNRKTIKAHRASWLIHRGEIPTGLLICHKCDNPPCTNPDHLFIGTAKENITDCINKNRRSYQKLSGIK